MLAENLDMSSITDAPRKAIEETIQPMADEEVKAPKEQLFPDNEA